MTFRWGTLCCPGVFRYIFTDHQSSFQSKTHCWKQVCPSAWDSRSNTPSTLAPLLISWLYFGSLIRMYQVLQSPIKWSLCLHVLSLLLIDHYLLNSLRTNPAQAGFFSRGRVGRSEPAEWTLGEKGFCLGSLWSSASLVIETLLWWTSLWQMGGVEAGWNDDGWLE